MAGVTGWLGDFFRLWWALLYWNARKSWYRFRGPGRARCPCQNFSDSGRALETQCEAVVFWREPARFRRVCPLLTRTPAGWRCAADAADVRPFWGRAAAGYGGALLACYLAATVTVFAVLRQVGYPLGYASVLLPHRWGDIRRAQEAVYAARAERDLAAGNFSAAILSLEVVHQRNPANEAAALMLAQLWQLSGRPHLADAVLARTIAASPENRAVLAQQWYRLLLARADFPQIKRMALALLAEDASQRVPWLNALLYACGHTKDPEPLAQLARSPAPLPGWCLALAAIEQAIIAGRRDEARVQLLRMPARTESNFVPYYHVDRLLALGYNREALMLLEQHAPSFSAVEASAFRLRAFAQFGWLPSLQSEFDSLLATLAAPQAATLLASHLLRFPDAGRAAALADRLIALNPEITPQSYPVVAAAYLACRRSRADEPATRLLAMLQNNTASRARALETAGVMLADSRREQVRLDLVLPAVALPIEIIYTLFDIHPPPTR